MSEDRNASEVTGSTGRGSKTPRKPTREEFAAFAKRLESSLIEDLAEQNRIDAAEMEKLRQEGKAPPPPDWWKPIHLSGAPRGGTALPRAVEPPGTPAVARPGPLPDVPYPCIVLFGAVSGLVRSGMRTADPPRGVGDARKEEAESRFLVERAAAVIEQLELAAREKEFDGPRTRLCFQERHNAVTGGSGIIVRRLLGPGRYTRPLAELLAPAGKLDDDSRRAADRLGWSAANRRLHILAFEELGEKLPRPAVFAAVETPDSNSSELLARLLVTPFEITQWSNAEFESGGGPVN